MTRNQFYAILSVIFACSFSIGAELEKNQFWHVVLTILSIMNYLALFFFWHRVDKEFDKNDN